MQLFHRFVAKRCWEFNNTVGVAKLAPSSG